MAARQGIRSYPDRPGSYRVLAAALGQLGRTAEAKEALEQAIAIAPEHVEADIRDAFRGYGPKTTLACSKACARPAGRTERTAISHRGGQSSRS